MVEKDLTERMLEDYNDVFADIVNVLLFKGRRIIREDDLIDSQAKSILKAEDGKLHSQERDVAKFWRDSILRIACLGIENQTSYDKDMPLRVISYDGASYKNQLLKENESDVRYPVVTLVLYFGTDSQWLSNINLKSCLKIPAELEPYVNDYKINLFQIAYLEDEIIDAFKSDFRIVADYFSQVRKNKSYNPSKQTIKHVQEILQFMSVVTQDDRFTDYQVVEKEGSVNNMCNIIDQYIEQGKEVGFEQGKEKGFEQGTEQRSMEIAKEMYSDGMSVELISKYVKYPVEIVKEWLGIAA